MEIINSKYLKPGQIVNIKTDGSTRTQENFSILEIIPGAGIVARQGKNAAQLFTFAQLKELTIVERKETPSAATRN